MRGILPKTPDIAFSMAEPEGKVARTWCMTPLLAALPILVELFTSEGCSSCPPADAALARLHERQPVPGVSLLVLSEHVDYWDRLGWRDPFSDPLYTDRQSRYAPKIAGDRVYTPQVVVDGRLDVLGSDEDGITRAAKAAAGEPHGTVTVTPGVRGVHPVHIAVAGLPPHSAAQVLLAVVEDGLSSKVERGENQGRTLPHTAVVRALKGVGSIAATAAAWSGEAEVPHDPAWKRTRVVIFVQDRESLRVLAAATL
jgi:hypothetical protein